MLFSFILMSVALPNLCVAETGSDPERIARGREVIRTRPLFTPFTTLQSFEELWTVWESEDQKNEVRSLSGEKLRTAIGKHYGFFQADYDNDGLPVGLMKDKNNLVYLNCYSCHASKINDKILWGANNFRQDVHSLIVDNLRLVEKNSKIPKDTLVNRLPTPFSITTGRMNVVKFIGVSTAFRDSNFDLRATPVDLDKVLALETNDIDAQPWWNSKLKSRFYWDGWMSSDADNHSADALGMIVAFGGEGTGIPQQLFSIPGEEIRKPDVQEDLAASYTYHMNTEVPRYPHPIDSKLAQEGQAVFEKKRVYRDMSCASCHGTYGENQKYPDRFISPLVVGTDPLRYKNMPEVFLNYYRSAPSRFGKHDVGQQRGYQAPPLNGIWASPPYFHNGAAPTLWDVLNPKERPMIWKVVENDNDMYDSQRVGLLVLRPKEVPAVNKFESRKYFDSRIPGNSIRGHEFGNALTSGERLAVVEYLKTL